MYGYGTRSYNRSTEHRENKRKCSEITAAYLEGRLRFPDVSGAFLQCRCSQYEYPHNPHWSDYGLFEFHRSLRHGTVDETRKAGGGKKPPSTTRAARNTERGRDGRRDPSPVQPVGAGNGSAGHRNRRAGKKS